MNATVGTPDHNERCLWRSPLTSHTMARVPTGRQFVNKTPIPAPRTSRATPAETHRLRANQHRSTTTIINQAFMREWAVSSGVVTRSWWSVGALERPTACSADRDRLSGQEVMTLLAWWEHGCRRLQPRCGARRFGAWAFIRHAQCGGHGAVRPQQQLDSFIYVDPHHRWGHA